MKYFKEYLSALLIIIIVMFYGYIYSLLDPKEIGFENPIDPFYFSFTTMSTVGYGDFSPKTNRSKLIVMSQQSFLIVSICMYLKDIVK
jgi:voltage-gated potassium channel